MKKKFISMIMALVLIVSVFGFSGNTSAAEGEYTEYFRINSVFTYSPSKTWDVTTTNDSSEGGNFMVRLYKKGTKTILFEEKGYIAGKTSEGPGVAKFVWYTPNSDNHSIDIVVYRDGVIIEPFTTVSSRR